MSWKTAAQITVIAIITPPLLICLLATVCLYMFGRALLAMIKP